MSENYIKCNDCDVVFDKLKGQRKNGSDQLSCPECFVTCETCKKQKMGLEKMRYLTGRHCPKCREDIMQGDKSIQGVPADENATMLGHIRNDQFAPCDILLCEEGRFCPSCQEISRLRDIIFSYEVRFDTNADDVDDYLELDEYDESMDAGELVDLDGSKQ